MPLLMEDLGGSIWPLALAQTLEEQALGTLLTQPGTLWDRKPALCSIWEECQLRLVFNPWRVPEAS